jgi:hypothetical protein
MCCCQPKPKERLRVLMDYVQAFVPLLLCLSLLYILNCSAVSEKSTLDYCSKLEATFSVPGQIPMTVYLFMYFLLWFVVALKYNT